MSHGIEPSIRNVLCAPKQHKTYPDGPVPSRRPCAHAALGSRRAEAAPRADTRSAPAPALPSPPLGAEPGPLPAARFPIAAGPRPAAARTHPLLRAPGPALAANQRRPLRRGGRDTACWARSLKQSGFRPPRAAPSRAAWALQGGAGVTCSERTGPRPSASARSCGPPSGKPVFVLVVNVSFRDLVSCRAVCGACPGCAASRFVTITNIHILKDRNRDGQRFRILSSPLLWFEAMSRTHILVNFSWFAISLETIFCAGLSKLTSTQ